MDKAEIVKDEDVTAVTSERLWNRNYILCCVANFLSFFAFYILLPVLPLYLNEEMMASKSVIGMVLSLYAIACLVIRPFSGFIVDSYPRKTVLVWSFAAFTFFFGGYLVATTIMLFAVVRALHGFSYGAVSVSNSTVAIDVMPPKKRGSGIAYYGVANNLAMCIGPAVSLYIYQSDYSFNVIFVLALVSSFLAFLAVSMVVTPKKDLVRREQKLSLDRFWLMGTWRQSINLLFVAFAYGLMTTFLAIYGKEKIGVTDGSGNFFLLLAIGIIISRIIASKNINNGKVTVNIIRGTAILTVGYAVFALWTAPKGYFASAFIIGMGQGMLAPAYQTVFINLAPNSLRGTANSTYLTSWDVGAAAGIFMGGFIVDHAGYFCAFITCAAMVFIALLMFSFISGPHFNRCKLR